MEKQKRYQSIFKNWLFFDTATTILAAVGLVLGIVNFELDISCLASGDCNDLNVDNPDAM